jgi:hypothetical protein
MPCIARERCDGIGIANVGEPCAGRDVQTVVTRQANTVNALVPRRQCTGG